MTLPDSVTVFGKQGSASLSATKSGHEFICTMDWDDSEIESPGTIKITGSSFKLDFRFMEEITKEDSYTGILNCKARGYSFPLPVSLYIKRYSSYPLTILTKSVYVNSTDQDVRFTVRNNLDWDITPQIKLSGDPGFFEIPPTVTLNPNEEKDIILLNNIPPDMNFSRTMDVSLSVFNTTSSLPVIVDVIYIPERGFNFLPALLIFLAVAAPLGAISYLGYRYRKEIQKYLNKFNFVKIREEIKTNIGELENMREEERLNSIINMIEILRFQKKSDEDIKKALLQNFSVEDIKKASLKGNIKLTGFEEK